MITLLNDCQILCKYSVKIIFRLATNHQICCQIAKFGDLAKFDLVSFWPNLAFGQILWPNHQIWWFLWPQIWSFFDDSPNLTKWITQKNGNKNKLFITQNKVSPSIICVILSVESRRIGNEFFLLDCLTFLFLFYSAHFFSFNPIHFTFQSREISNHCHNVF